MKTNETAPWMGELAWVGDPRTGTSKKGNEWKSVDFVLKYKDPQGNDGNILFSVFGAEKVDKILSTPIGAMVKVMWRPEAREYNGKWFGKRNVYDVSETGDRPQPQTTAPAPEQTELPKSAPAYKPTTTNAEADDDGDLPF